MQPRGLTGKLAGLSSRNPLAVVLLWFGLLLLVSGVLGLYPAAFSTDIAITNNPESQRGADLIAQRWQTDDQPSPDELVIVSSDTLTIDSPEFQTFADALIADMMVMDGYIGMVASYQSTGQESLIADDRQAMILPVFFSSQDPDIHPLLDLLAAKDGQNGFTVVTGGAHSIDAAFIETTEGDLLTGEVIGVSVAMLVLVIVFGALVAAGIPLLLAIVTIMAAMGVVSVIAHFTDLSIFVINMMIMIGLAVGIDYSLFIIGRFREERANGASTQDAIIRTGDSASKAVLFSGLTVIVALLGLLIVPSSLFKSLGAGAIIVVLLAVLATLTLLPAIISLLGDRINLGQGRTLLGAMSAVLLLFAGVFQVFSIGRFFIITYITLAIVLAVMAALNFDPFHRRSADDRGGFWARTTRFVLQHPLALVIVTVAALLGASSIYFTINLGESGISTLPEETSARRAFDLLEGRFSAISLESPNQIVVDAGNVTDSGVQAAIGRLTTAIDADPDFGPVVVETNAAQDLALITIPAVHDTRSTDSLDSISRLRDHYIPEAFSGVDADVLVTGPTAFSLDFISLVNSYTPLIFSVVLGASLLLLLVAFRSLVIPIKSVIMNLLSVGASYGLMVLVFQHGIGNEIFGFRQVERIDAWIPLLMFSILFGLSMDYHVFLLSRIRERYDQIHSNPDSIAHGLRTTANIITGAALIMVAVFGGFAMGELSIFQQMGFGLAVAVILDATIIRTILVPASMSLLGSWNWYFPRWLEWLPKINVEGVPEEAQAEPIVAD